MPIGKFIKNFSSEQQLKNCLYSLTQGFKSDWRFLAGCLVSVFLFFSFSVMFFLGVVASMEASGQDKSKVIFAFEAALFFASAINFGVATEGFDFAKDFKNRVLNYIISFSVIILSLIFLLSVYFNVAKNLLALPYNMFKIGSYNADITLDGNYIEKSQQLRDIGLSAVHNEACFKVFSSMGAEYIVKHLSNDKCTNTNAKKSHSEKDDSKEEISKQKVKYILRIPKSQVILIGYIDSKR
ncbi:MAG: hypothetical protein HY099_01250 [Nitrospirae bacterium]|nr:hypothetical protein [Nitrospirota bacterium]